jgi:hypothetical protein
MIRRENKEQERDCIGNKGRLEDPSSSASRKPDGIDVVRKGIDFVSIFPRRGKPDFVPPSCDL